ncbi:hypothetical protein M9Y10_037919 [Tritrichomonas musculus]|uniref:Myb-like DNA-binding domain containing protein n=1 Tax=Tritrichomonas musculus TaxID=1915356 RepID=A0ABR2K703_9EUKA
MTLHSSQYNQSLALQIPQISNFNPISYNNQFRLSQFFQPPFIRYFPVRPDMLNKQASKIITSQILRSNNKNHKVKKQQEKNDLKIKSSREIFTINEDKKLIELYSIYQDDWKTISEFMPNRTIRQCKERYLHYLSPEISQSLWTEDEDELLIQKVNTIGKRWKILEQFFKGRTEISIRNRWNMLVRKEKREIKKQIQNNKNHIKKFYSQISFPSQPHNIKSVNEYSMLNTYNHTTKNNDNLFSNKESVSHFTALQNNCQRDAAGLNQQSNINIDLEKDYSNNKIFIDDLSINKVFDLDISLENDHTDFF